MPKTIDLPISTYRISSSPNGRKWGSPAALPLATTHRALAKVPLDRVPKDATITLAELHVFAERPDANGGNIRVTAPTQSWKSSVTWPGPNVGAVLATTTPGSLVDRQEIVLAVTAWATTRSRNGLRIESSTVAPSGVWIAGSSASRDKPFVRITYTIPPDVPGNLVPDGGSVSVAAPILTYAGDDQMVQQQVQFSNDGITPTYTSAWLAATEGRYDPADDPGANPVLADGGAGIYWRVKTNGPDGESAWSEWAYYEYDVLLNATLDNPGAVTADGSPPVQWTVTSGAQTSFKAEFHEGSTVVDQSTWTNEPATREWQPGKAIKVPGHTGKITLRLRDAVVPRVAAEGAPAELVLTQTFVTTLAGEETAVSGLAATFDDPVVTLTGSVSSLISPDQIGLFRDGVQVPIWNADGEGFLWAPIGDFVDGSDDFVIKDFTAPLRGTHTWQVYVQGAGVEPVTGPEATLALRTRSIWVVDPRTGDKIEIVGVNGVPAIEQETVEQSVLHVPVNGGLKVEPKRRRLSRLTRNGTAEGAVMNEHEAILNGWADGDSGLKYRLVFGKVNWPVIIGDYDPADVEAYPDACGPDRVMVKFNWWQRLADL